MLYHDGTHTSGAYASPVSVFGDLVCEVKLRETVQLTPSLLQEHSDADLLSSFCHLQQLNRLFDAITLRFFQELSSRSPVSGPSLARDHGHKDALDLLVRLTGASRPEVRARLELASVLPAPEPGWASSSPDFVGTADPNSGPSGGPDATDPGSGDLPPPPCSPEPEPLFSYVAKGLQSGELPEKTAMKITQEIGKFQEETTNTTPEQILHAEKLLVAQAIGAGIPDDKTQDFILDFNFGTGFTSATETSGTSGDSGAVGSAETPDTTGDTAGDTTPQIPSRPSRPARPNLPLPSNRVGRAATNVLKKIAPTSKRVEKTQTARRCVKLGRNVNGLVQISGWVLPEVAALMQRAFDALLSPRTTLPDDLSKTSARGETGAFGQAGTSCKTGASGETGALGKTNTLGKSGAFGTQRGTGTTGTTTTAGGTGGSGVRFTKTNSTGTSVSNSTDTSSETGANPELTITDDRTPDQKRHDAFAALMEAALKTGHLPQTANGAATLVVTISEEELAKPDGTGRMIDHFGKETPITARTARHTACNGKVMLMRQTRTGRIVELKNYQRVFTEHQRKAIIARDGGCVIPGCDIPAGWCEIHHVIPWSENGSTSTDNGVAVCWWHHRTIETSGWNIRMRDGVPEIKAPPGIDPEQKWRRSRPRVPEHAIMFTPEPARQELDAQETAALASATSEPTQQGPALQRILDWGTLQTEEPF